MNMGFLEIIGAIEAQLSTEYLPGAIKWADETHSNAWSNALDRFDKALTIAIERQDFGLAKVEGEFYKTTILDLISSYKRHKNMDETQSFLDSMRSSTTNDRKR